jgi:glucitol operon activator protein
LFAVIFGLISLQMLMGLFQVFHYQKTLKKWKGKGLLGVGQKKGGIKPGEILILVYDRNNNRVISVQRMKGYTIFANFREVKEYSGLPLEEIRRIGMEIDAKEFKGYRKKNPYDPSVLSKKKGALIQAVEAVDRYLRRQAEEEGDDDEGTG